MAENKRADIVLYKAGLAESRTRARGLIKNGLAFINGTPISKPSELIDPCGVLTLARETDGQALSVVSDVSRAGQKLRTALETFGLDAAGMVFADIGASTGGFTQCLLERGAARVYAVDVGEGQLHPSLQADPRVVNMEGVNARFLTADSFPMPLNGAVMDVSFISQTLIYPALARVLPPGAPLVTLVKPQFEAGRENVGKNGVVKDKDGLILEAVKLKIRLAAQDCGFSFEQMTESPVKGAKGNREYLVLLRKI